MKKKCLLCAVLMLSVLASAQARPSRGRAPISRDEAGVNAAATIRSTGRTESPNTDPNATAIERPPANSDAKGGGTLPSSGSIVAIHGLSCDSTGSTGAGIRVASWSTTITNPFSSGGKEPSPAGATFQDVVVTRKIDECSSYFVQLLVTGASVKQLRLVQTNSMGDLVEVDLSNATVTSYQIVSDTAVGGPIEALTFSYRKFTLSEKQSGTSSPNPMCFDLASAETCSIN